MEFKLQALSIYEYGQRKDKDGNPLKEGQAAPELLTMMATDYVNMGGVKMQKGNLPDSAALPEGGTQRILVVGGGFSGLTAALEAARSGYEVVLVEKTGELGGAAKNIPVGSPLSAPWDDKEPLKLDEKIAACLDSIPLSSLTTADAADEYVI